MPANQSHEAWGGAGMVLTVLLVAWQCDSSRQSCILSLILRGRCCIPRWHVFPLNTGMLIQPSAPVLDSTCALLCSDLVSPKASTPAKVCTDVPLPSLWSPPPFFRDLFVLLFKILHFSSLHALLLLEASGQVKERNITLAFGLLQAELSSAN